jgi:glycosyltransferase involved in cell wall biosynthesis
MKFSICIPNYNYAPYIERAVLSALSQRVTDLEVIVSDDASRDDSVARVAALGDPRVRIVRNQHNVGMVPNFERAARLGCGQWQLVLPSDDMLHPDALATYRALHEAIGSSATRSLFSAALDLVDVDDKVIGHTGPNRLLWTKADRARELESVVDAPVYRVRATEMLRRCLSTMRNPCLFSTTLYPRDAYERVEGYSCARLYNADKWFHWKLLQVLDTAYFVDRPLAGFRLHGGNATTSMQGQELLRFIMDEYMSTRELDDRVLRRVGLEREDVVRGFIEHDIARHGLSSLARGQTRRARQLLGFARWTYHTHLRRNAKVWLLEGLLALGPAGRAASRAAHAIYRGLGLQNQP